MITIKRELSTGSEVSITFDEENDGPILTLKDKCGQQTIDPYYNVQLILKIFSPELADEVETFFTLANEIYSISKSDTTGTFGNFTFTVLED